MPELPDIKNMRLAEETMQPPNIIMPCHFAAPTNTPMHVDVMGVYDERGVWWVMVRIETVHGSFVSFLSPEVAKNVEHEMGEARAAQLTTPFVAPGSNGT